MKTIHESLTELLELMQELGDKGIGITIIGTPQELLPVPDEVTKSLANAYLPSILEFYKNEDNLNAYNEWKETQNNTNKTSA
ncbi:MAG: hypothetical protein R3Y12_08470 [Clostridia bacterium]